ncbi:MAG TPA: roadblock/LC7 domain-containing protein [Streptosporangiaceae bacterium]
MNALSSEAQSLTWLVNKFVAEVPGVRHAVVVSADGLALIASDELTGERAQQLSAVASGTRSLAETSARLFSLGGSNQTMVRMERGYLFVMAISDGSCLATLASAGCDMKIVAYQMTRLVESSGHVLTSQIRQELRGEARAARVS